MLQQTIESTSAHVSEPPSHPGEVLYKQYLEPLGISIQGAATEVGVTRQSMSNLVNGHCCLSVNMALSLSRVFGRSAREWVYLQAEWDLWQARQGH